MLLKRKFFLERFKKEIRLLKDEEFWEVYDFIKKIAEKKINKSVEKDFDFWSDEEINNLGKIGIHSGFFN